MGLSRQLVQDYVYSRIDEAARKDSSHDLSHLKHHKPLPHPTSDLRDGHDLAGSIASNQDPNEAFDSIAMDRSHLDTSPPRRNPVTSLPPTPPSNLIEGEYQIHAKPPTYLDGVARHFHPRESPIVTPINQRSPPTPETTPPRTTESLAVNYPSSHADSFTTAREQLWSSDDEDRDHYLSLDGTPMQSFTDLNDHKILDRPLLGREAEAGGWKSVSPGPVAAKLERRLRRKKGQNNVALYEEEDVDHIPDREWDTNLMRNVTIRRGRQIGVNTTSPTQELRVRTPTTPKALEKEVDLREGFGNSQDSPKTPDMHSFAEAIGWNSEVDDKLQFHLQGGEMKRLSDISSASTVVEAVVVATPPQRQRTLRHVSRNLSLRESAEQSPVDGQKRDSFNSDDSPLHRLRHKRLSIPERRNRGSVEFDLSTEGASSRRTSLIPQPELSIPVVVIPQRRSSLSPESAMAVISPSETFIRSRPSTAPEGGKLTMETMAMEIMSRDGIQYDVSVDGEAGEQRGGPNGLLPSPHTLRRKASWPIQEWKMPQQSVKEEMPPHTLGTCHNANAQKHSISAQEPTDGLATTDDAKTTGIMDVSRGSEDEQDDRQRPLTPVASVQTERGNLAGPFHDFQMTDRGQVIPDDAPDDESRRRDADGRLSKIGQRSRPMSLDRSTWNTDEHATARHMFSQTTPYSRFSETPDQLEVSEATAVNIYPHNNHSLLVVQHAPRQTFESDAGIASSAQPQPIEMIVQPSTPPQKDLPPAGVDSPLKNPRKPPEPPALKVIPPTPAAELERQLETAKTNVTPTRSRSLVQRARRYSDSLMQPFLGRSNSLVVGRPVHRAPTVGQREHNKLHPFWRPRGFWNDLSDSEDEPLEEDDRLPQGGDTSNVVVPQRSALGSLRRSAGDFLVGNTLGISRAGTQSRKHRVTVPASSVRRAGQQVRMSHTGVVANRYSSGSLRRAGSRRIVAPRVHTLPGLGGLSLQPFGGLWALREKMRARRFEYEARKSEERRNKLRKQIGSRFVVEGATTV